VDVPLSDEPPLAPVAISFASDPPTVPASAPRSNRSERASALRRLMGWLLDLALIAALTGAHLWLALRLAAPAQPWLDLLLAAPLPWLLLAAILAVACSWLSVALCGRTPGMALTGQRLQSLPGGALTPLQALARALLSVLSAAAGLFGFVLAAFDARGQTLHDKLCRCVAVVD